MPLTPAAAHRKDLNAKPATMSHAHFRFLAGVLRDLQAKGNAEDAGAVEKNEGFAAYRMQYRLADALALTNPRFNRARFLAACTPEA